MPLALQTKSRSLLPSGASGRHWTQFHHFAAGLQPKTFGTFVVDMSALKGRQITASENHPGWADASPTDGDVGGPFSMSLKKAIISSPQVTMTGSTVKDGVGYTAGYTGPFLALNPASQYLLWPSLAGRSQSALEAMGTKAIAIVKPTNSIADAATALIELYREGLPKMVGASLWKEKTRKHLTPKQGRRKTGGEYLNVEFGWKPLVGEIQDVYKAIKKSDAVIKQYERDAGKVVRRKFEFPSEEWTDSKVYIDGAIPHTWSSTIIMKNQNARGKVIQTDTYFRRTWFSGAFTYHLPGDWYKQGSSSKLDALLGTKITPEVVWNITPWSWFADWFANTGDVISNLTDMASDGLVLRYGYIMEHEKHVRVYSWQGPHPFNTDAVPSSIELVVETKRRLAATPYGFGITWEGFSPRQLAILAALGLSRSGKGK